MSAEFDDLVARIQRLAMDELCAKHRDTYPTPAAIAEQEADLFLRLWRGVAADGAAIVGGPYRAPGSGPYYTIDLPGGVTYTAREREVPSTPRDPIYDAIAAH